MDNGFQVKLEEDGVDSTRQSRMETSGLWPICSTGSVNAEVRLLLLLLLMLFPYLYSHIVVTGTRTPHEIQ